MTMTDFHRIVSACSLVSRLNPKYKYLESENYLISQGNILTSQYIPRTQFWPWLNNLPNIEYIPLKNIEYIPLKNSKPSIKIVCLTTQFTSKHDIKSYYGRVLLRLNKKFHGHHHHHHHHNHHHHHHPHHHHHHHHYNQGPPGGSFIKLTNDITFCSNNTTALPVFFGLKNLHFLRKLTEQPRL